MAATTALSPIIDQAENLGVMGLVITVTPESGPPEEVLSAPTWSLSRPIPHLTITPAMVGGVARYALSATDLFGLIPDGTIKYVIGATPHTVTSFDALPGPPADIYDYAPPAAQEATSVLTLTVQSSIYGPVSFPLNVHVTGSYSTGADRLVAAVATLGS